MVGQSFDITKHLVGGDPIPYTVKYTYNSVFLDFQPGSANNEGSFNTKVYETVMKKITSTVYNNNRVWDTTNLPWDTTHQTFPQWDTTTFPSSSD